MTTATKHQCPQCGYTADQSGLCPRCDYRVKLIPEGQKRQFSAEFIIAMGMLATMTHEEQERIKDTCKTLHQVLDRLPREEALVAIMVFTSEYAQKVKA